MENQEKYSEPMSERQHAISSSTLQDCCLKEERVPIREVNITPLDLGFIVRVGCQAVAVTSKKALIEELTKYYTNPAETEKRYNSGEFGEKNNR